MAPVAAIFQVVYQKTLIYVLKMTYKNAFLVKQLWYA